MASWNCKKCPAANQGATCTNCGWVPKHDDLPTRVCLCAIGYNLRSIEGAVLFSAEIGIAGCYTRMTFTRKCGCWYVENIDSDNSVMVSHIQDAMELIEMWFGGNHVMPRGEDNP